MLSAESAEFVKTGCSFKTFLQVIPRLVNKFQTRCITSKHYSTIANDTQVEEPCILFILEALLIVEQHFVASCGETYVELCKALPKMSCGLSQFPLDR